MIDSMNLIISDEDAPPSVSSELDAALKKVAIGSKKNKSQKVKVVIKIVQVKLEAVESRAEIFGVVLHPGTSCSDAVALAPA